MQIPHYKLKLDNFYSELKQFCVDTWLNHTTNSDKAINIINLKVDEYYHSAIFCLENNIAPTIVDLVGHQHNRHWSTALLIDSERQSGFGDFDEYLKSEGGNKMVAPYAIIVPIVGDVTVNFKEYNINVINNKTYSFDNNLIKDTQLSLKLDAPYLVPSIYPVDIMAGDQDSLYLIYRFITRAQFIHNESMPFILKHFKSVRLKQ